MYHYDQVRSSPQSLSHAVQNETEPHEQYEEESLSKEAMNEREEDK